MIRPMNFINHPQDTNVPVTAWQTLPYARPENIRAVLVKLAAMTVQQAVSARTLPPPTRVRVVNIRSSGQHRAATALQVSLESTQSLLCILRLRKMNQCIFSLYKTNDRFVRKG